MSRARPGPAWPHAARTSRGREAPFSWPRVAAAPGSFSRSQTPLMDHQGETWADRSTPESLAANHRRPKLAGVASARRRGRGDKRGRAAADLARTQHSCGFAGRRLRWRRTGTATGTGRGQRGQGKEGRDGLTLSELPFPAVAAAQLQRIGARAAGQVGPGPGGVAKVWVLPL